MRGRLTPGVARARDVLALMRAGAVDGLSIGFRTVKGRTDPRTGIRELLEVDLWEISVVHLPDAADGADLRGEGGGRGNAGGDDPPRGAGDAGRRLRGRAATCVTSP